MPFLQWCYQEIGQREGLRVMISLQYLSGVPPFGSTEHSGKYLEIPPRSMQIALPWLKKKVAENGTASILYCT